MMAFQRIKCRGKLVNSFDSEAESNFRQKWSEGNDNLKGALGTIIFFQNNLSKVKEIFACMLL